MKKIIFLISFLGLSLHAQNNVTSKNIFNFNYQVAEENVIKT
ncbi:MAG: peptidase M28, partial [Flavobacteriaceae bacterium]